MISSPVDHQSLQFLRHDDLNGPKSRANAHQQQLVDIDKTNDYESRSSSEKKSTESHRLHGTIN